MKQKKCRDALSQKYTNRTFHEDNVAPLTHEENVTQIKTNFVELSNVMNNLKVTYVLLLIVVSWLTNLSNRLHNIKFT